MVEIKKDDWYALLISGDEPRFAQESTYFQNFLTNEARFNPKNIRHIICTHHARDCILEGTQTFINLAKELTDNPNILFLYNGHGRKGSFGGERNFFSIRTSLKYSRWAKLIRDCGKYIFINDSCHSGSSIKAFEKQGLLPNKGMVITSSATDELSCDWKFLNRLIKSYKNREPFTNKEIYEHELIGRIILTSPKEELEDTISAAFFDQKEELFDKPIYSGTIQHPQKRGLPLEEILYSLKPQD